MKRTSKTKRTVSAESIARLADKGTDVSAYFTNKGKMLPPIDNVGIDLNKALLEELNEAAKRLNVSRQTLIKRFIRRGLDQHYLAQKERKAG
ncbi:MAG TPA: CopG family transcriptional regulator [Pyrinomonadaceae bacterium]|nr:CopG family transcriptional regulator [Pyrinomonadaceae bacterium]